MHWLNGTWMGVTEFRGMRTSVIISYLSSQDILVMSFPHFQMNNIVVKQYCKKRNGVQFSVFNNLNYGRVFIQEPVDQPSVKILCSLSSGEKVQVFYCNRISEYFHVGKPQYGPIPIRGKLLQLLKTYNTYNTYACNEKAFLIEYPSYDTPILNLIREEVPLPDTNHCNSELEAVFKILRWTNKSFSTGPMVELPMNRNALIFFQHPTKKLNCRGYSIVLNDVLNSKGIKCRMIQCRAYDPYDLECHFVNEYYSEELKKWILLDASFGCIIVTKENLPLNAYEVRLNITKHIPMFLMSGKNTLRCIDKNTYWYGLTKNLFTLSFYKSYVPGFDDELSNNRTISVFPCGYIHSFNIPCPLQYTNNIEQFYI